MKIKTFLGPELKTADKGYFILDDGRYAVVLYDEKKYAFLSPQKFWETFYNWSRQGQPIDPGKKLLAQQILNAPNNQLGKDPCAQARKDLERDLESYRAEPNPKEAQKTYSRGRQKYYRFILCTKENIEFFNNMMREIGVPVLG